ncbi:MAG: TMEM165/GDT1 family protein [Actinobacteria bacterium]|nr:TMEM165/GDT1 family protein [Actinomycetota bacterium]
MSSTLQSFAAVFPAELPDKTMFATIVLTTRYRRPLAIWLGSAGAFFLHVSLAVAAGSLLSLLPTTVVTVLVMSMFAIGAAFLLKEALGSDDDEDEEFDLRAGSTAKTAAIAAFALIGMAELGDLTQLTTASLAAKTGTPFHVGVGAFAALLAVSALAATFGARLTERISMQKLNFVGAAVFAGFAAWTALELF